MRATIVFFIHYLRLTYHIPEPPHPEEQQLVRTKNEFNSTHIKIAFMASSFYRSCILIVRQSY